MDYTVPIDITEIQDTADKIKPKIKTLMMQNIRTILATLANNDAIQASSDLLTFIDGTSAMPYDPDLSVWNKLGDIKKRTINVKVGMVPIKDEVERYRKTYLVTLDDLNLNQSNLPFAKWYVETITGVGLKSLYVLPYQGVLNASGTTAIDICDGYFKIITDEKNANNITVAKGNLYELTGGASDYTASNIGDLLLEQYDLFPDITKQEAMVEIRLAYRYRKLYRQWLKTEYPYISAADLNASLDSLEGTDGKTKFLWESGMGSSKKVIMNVPGNLIYGTDRDNKEFGKMEIFKPNPFYIACVNKIVLGFQIYTLDPRAFIVNNL
jgi:hypothetical protein